MVVIVDMVRVSWAVISLAFVVIHTSEVEDWAASWVDCFAVFSPSPNRRPKLLVKKP
jgi:hypothetical protein